MECSLTKLKRGGKGRPKAEVRPAFSLSRPSTPPKFYTLRSYGGRVLASRLVSRVLFLWEPLTHDEPGKARQAGFQLAHFPALQISAAD